jgi:hypothetical protein
MNQFDKNLGIRKFSSVAQSNVKKNRIKNFTETVEFLLDQDDQMKADFLDSLLKDFLDGKANVLENFVLGAKDMVDELSAET